MRQKPSIERLREALEYNAETGIFIWRIQANPRAMAGARAGNRCNEYREIQLDRMRFYEHQAAIAITTGKWPEHEVDHRNGLKSDNRLSNLRPATSTQNKANKGKPKNNTSGVKGVQIRHDGRFVAHVGHRNRSLHIGVFMTIEEAAAARAAASVVIFGEFSRP